MYRLMLIVVLTALFSAPAQAKGEIAEVVSVGPSWNTFTNEDGTGLYHEVLRQIFDLYGIKVRHIYVPTDRGDQLVREGQADMMVCDDRAESLLVGSRYPMYTNDYFAFFKKSRIGPWHGPETLDSKEVAFQLGYYHDWDFPVPVMLRSMKSGVKCLEMVLLGRTDFYVDDMNFIQKSIEQTELAFNRSEFEIKRIGTRSYHPIFSATPKAATIMKMFDDGIAKLHKAGKLKPIYDKWGHDYPDFDSF